MVSSSTLTNNLNKVRQLSRNERRQLFQAVLLLPLIHFALLLLGYYRVRRVIEKLIPLKPGLVLLSDTQILERARENAQMVGIAAQYGLYKATCLRRSLLTWGFLRRQGIESQICFGVRMCTRKLEAHAWLEYKGIVVNDSLEVHERYTALREALPPTRTGL